MDAWVYFIPYAWFSLVTFSKNNNNLEACTNSSLLTEFEITVHFIGKPIFLYGTKTIAEALKQQVTNAAVLVSNGKDQRLRWPAWFSLRQVYWSSLFQIKEPPTQTEDNKTTDSSILLLLHPSTNDFLSLFLID